MAEYYPLLAKAVGSLPQSTPETRRIVYERARKALIGQLRTLHPPVPDEDIEQESVALDRAIERLEAELAAGSVPPPPEPVAPPPVAPESAPSSPPTAPPSPPAEPPAATTATGGALGPAAQRPVPPLRPKFAKPLAPRSLTPRTPSAPPVPVAPALPPAPEPVTETPVVEATAAAPDLEPIGTVDDKPAKTLDDKHAPIGGKKAKPPRGEPQRPIAPQPRKADGQRRRLWIIPVGIGVVVALVAVAAWKLRDRPETIARTKPAEQTQADSGKIADRVGGTPPSQPAETPSTDQAPKEQPASPSSTATEQPKPAPATPAPSNPEIPVAHRAALLVEAPEEQTKVKTFLGTVVWKLNNEPQGQNDAVGLAVEADIDLPDDKMKAIVTFEKNTDASLPASHTIKVRFVVEPGSFSGNVKQISVPQMRPEASPSGEPLAGVTVPVIQDSFLVGLSPGTAENSNIDLMRKLQWIDIPMLLDSGKIAKLTFEKSDSGQRYLNEAFDAWQKQ